MTEQKKGGDKRISLAPLDFEEALSDLLKVEPPPKDKKEPAPQKERRPRKKDSGAPST